MWWGVGVGSGGGLGELDGGAGDGVRAAAAGRGAVLGGTGLAAALDLVEEREQAELAEFGEGGVGRGACGAGAESGGVGLVDVGDAVVGAVHEGDEGREQAEDLPEGEFVEGGDDGGGRGARSGARSGARARTADGGVGWAPVRRDGGPGGAAGGRDRALTPLGLGGGVFGPGGGATLRSGEPGAPAREVHCVQASWCRSWSLCLPQRPPPAGAGVSPEVSGFGRWTVSLCAGVSPPMVTRPVWSTALTTSASVLLRGVLRPPACGEFEFCPGVFEGPEGHDLAFEET
ncbi:hypothetical protein GCM10020254_46080 [Streptomyces goshikiensis]